MGIVDICGNEVVPVEYDHVQNFVDKNFQTTTLENNHIKVAEFNFFTREIIPYHTKIKTSSYVSDYEEEPYGSNYGKYAGTYAQDVMGFSDDVIDDVFEGDPEACWNVD